METVIEIWNQILEFLKNNLTATAINTWFSDCEAIDLTENSLVIYTPADVKRKVIISRFSKMINDELSEIFSCEYHITMLAGKEELEEYKKKKRTEENLPEMAGYTFDRFVVGPSNTFAYAASVAVANNPGTTYNPLFIYGNSGLGKTHLLLSIGQAIHEKNPTAKIAYVKGDEFTVQMINSIKTGTAEDFRQKYRYVDLFLVDDIQFIAGKEQTQDEFFHTFNNIYESGNQIVITSDRPPIDMLKLDDRLRTRFEGGLMADVQPPDVETRMAIISKKSAQLGLILSDDIVSFIANNLTSNVRQIEGVVNKLTAIRNLNNCDITIEDVRRAIKDVIRVGVYVPTPDIIIEETAKYYNLTPDDLKGQKRQKNITMARQVSMYLIRTITNMSLKDTGDQYEDRTHSTVLSSIRKVEDLLKTDPNMTETIRDITSNINSRN